MRAGSRGDECGLAFTVGQDHGLLYPDTEGSPDDQVRSATVIVTVDDRTGMITSIVSERRRTYRAEDGPDRDVLERAELTLGYDSDATITAPAKARDIDEDTWGTCAYGGDCRTPG